MIINGDNYQKMKESIDQVINEHGDLSDAYQAKGLSFERFCWDIFHASQFRIGDGIGIIGDINIPNCKDTHIFTAMKRMVAENQISGW